MFDYTSDTLKFRSPATPLVGAALLVLGFLAVTYLLRQLVLGSPGIVHLYLLLIVTAGILFNLGATVVVTLACILIVVIAAYSYPGGERIETGLEVLLFIAAAALSRYLFYETALREHQANRNRVVELGEEINERTFEYDKGFSKTAQLKIRAEQFQQLEGIATQFGNSMNFGEVAKRAVLETHKLFPETTVVLYLVDGAHVTYKEAAGPAGEIPNAARLAVLADDEINRTIMRTINGIRVDDVTREFRFKDIDPDDFVSLIAEPLIAGSVVTGILRLHSHQRNAFSTDSRRLLSLITNLAACALQNATLYSKIEEMAMVDGLTELHKRWYFDDRLNDECQRARRYRFPLTIMMTDIDHFKDVNDTYGHIIGDQILKNVAGVVRACVREVDLAGRYGGEEFIVIMPRCERGEAAAIAERIRREVAAHAGEALPDRRPVTLSIGLASFPADVGDTAQLVGEADRALYEAKRGGRNLVVLRTADGFSRPAPDGDGLVALPPAPAEA